jgi:hypothetical protein
MRMGSGGGWRQGLRQSPVHEGSKGAAPQAWGATQQGSVGSSGEERGMGSRKARGSTRGRSLLVRAIGTSVGVQQARASVWTSGR